MRGLAQYCFFITLIIMVYIIVDRDFIILATHEIPDLSQTYTTFIATFFSNLFSFLIWKMCENGKMKAWGSYIISQIKKRRRDWDDQKKR